MRQIDIRTIQNGAQKETYRVGEHSDGGVEVFCDGDSVYIPAQARPWIASLIVPTQEVYPSGSTSAQIDAIAAQCPERLRSKLKYYAMLVRRMEQTLDDWVDQAMQEARAIEEAGSKVIRIEKGRS